MLSQISSIDTTIIKINSKDSSRNFQRCGASSYRHIHKIGNVYGEKWKGSRKEKKKNTTIHDQKHSRIPLSSSMNTRHTRKRLGGGNGDETEERLLILHFSFTFLSDENVLTGTRIERESCLHSAWINGAWRN